jgi:lysophospholipase L1-like esterase
VNLLVAIVPLLLFLLLAELGLRVYLRDHIFYDVEMSRYARLLKIDSENPRVGHVHRPGGEARLMGVDVHINSAGFRDDELPVERSQRRRLVFLGDSLTFGWGVEKEATFEHRLERALDAQAPPETLNMAAGNYNTTQQGRLFRDVGLAYQPDEVVLFYFINDAEPPPEKSRAAWLGSLRIATFYWSRVKALLARWSAAPDWAQYYSALYEEGSPGWEATRQAFRTLRDVCRERNIGLRVVLLPELHQLTPYRFTREYARVHESLSALDVPVRDLAPFFAGETDPQRFWVAPDDAHPNAEAHARIAEYTLPFLLEASDS